MSEPLPSPLYPITSATVTLPPGDAPGDVALPAYVAQPAPDTAPTPTPGIVVLQEIFGVNNHIRGIVDRLASLGYTAIAPALFQRTAPGLALGYTEDDITLGRSHKDQTTAPQLLADVQRAIDYLLSLSTVKSQGFGTIGFCFGGHVAYLAATLPAVKATASFYGAGITNWGPGNSAPTLTRTPAIGGTVYGFFGLEDPLIPNPEVDELEQALITAAIPHQIFRYPGAGHGFCCDQRGDYRPEACADAWGKVQQLFSTL